jgi:threonine/homoserine/homoserine lactone efflux protein
MPDLVQVTGFVLFSAVAAGSPGPSNTMLTAIGARSGVRQGLSSALGAAAGMGGLLFAVALGVGELLLTHPRVLQVMQWGGAAMLCWMAWRIATADHDEAAFDRAGGFLAMTVFQWVNPKGWLVAVAAVATYLDQRSGIPLAQASVLATTFTLVAVPSFLPWLLAGAALQRFLRSPRARRTINTVMALLLATSAILLVGTHH